MSAETDILSGKRWRVDHGDALEVLAGLPEGCVDFVCADPVYGTASKTKVCVRSGGRRIEAFDLEWDRERDWSWVPEAARVLRPGGAWFTFTDVLALREAWDAAASAGMRPASPFAWTRHDPPPNPRLQFCSAFDGGVYAIKPGGERFWSGAGTTRNVFECSPSKGADRWNYPHPTQKPLELIRHLVRLLCPPGGLVCDPFAGSGTTGVAALAEGCRALLVERDAGYVEIARARLRATAASPLGYRSTPERAEQLDLLAGGEGSR